MKLSRRQLAQAAAASAGAALLPAQTAPPRVEFPKVDGLTRQVATFIVNTTYKDIPADVIELGRKSIIDGLGLALAGSVAETGPLTREHLKSQGVSGGATVIG